jgi:hypothetical protein
MRVAIVSSYLILLVSANEETSSNLQVALLGINCRGNSLCGGSMVAKKLYDTIQTIPDSKHYDNGYHITCQKHLGGGICAFLQGTSNGLDGAQIKQLALQILLHGCHVCGSVPINFPASNDPANGILTFNYVGTTSNSCGANPC